MERIVNYLKNNPNGLEALKIILLENIEYPVVSISYKAIRDLEEEMHEQSKL